MKNILLLLSKDSHTWQAVYQWIKNVTERSPDMLVKIVTVTPSFEQHLGLPFTSEWVSVQKALSVLVSHDHNENVNKSFDTSESFGDLAAALHDTANSLPYLGSSFEIFMFIEQGEEDLRQSNSNFVYVAGALRRLTEWHNGHLVMVKSGQELSQLHLQLAEFVHCQVVDSVEDLEFSLPCWSGKVAVQDYIENRGPLFSGFYLMCEDWDQLLKQKLPGQHNVTDNQVKTRQKHKAWNEQPQESRSSRAVCGRTMEILQEVDLRTLPLYLLDSWTLQLFVYEGYSNTFINYIQGQEQIGLLARLPVYPDGGQIPVCGAVTHVSTDAWKEKVIMDCQHLQGSQLEMAGAMEFLYLLLLPNIKKSSNQTTSFIRAQVLLSPHEINRDIFHILEKRVKFQNCAKSDAPEAAGLCSIGKKLILDKKAKFQMMLNHLSKNYTNVCNEYEENTLRGSKKEVKLETIRERQKKIVMAAFKGCKNMQEYMKDVSKPKFAQNIKWASEACLDSSKFPEKFALRATDTSRKMLQSFPSVDSSSALSPLSFPDLEKKKNTTDFEIHDILQLFHADGSHVTLPKTPEKLRGHSLCCMESQPEVNTPWPDSQLLRYHDVYYYRDETDWKFERKYGNIRDKGYFQDTRSSFVSPIKRRPLTKPASPVPVRWSPRRSVSSQHLMTSTSPKKTKLFDKSFKQPPARSSSPCKRQPSKISTLTPELSLTFGVSRAKWFSQDSNGFTPVTISNRSSCKRLPLSQTSCTSDSSDANPSENGANLSQPSPHLCGKRKKKTSDFINDPIVRRSPRKSTSALFGTPGLSEADRKQTDSKCSLPRNRKDTLSRSTDTISTKMKRSERHKMKLQKIIKHVLHEKGVKPGDIIYAACFKNLFNVSMVLLKTLPTSQNLTEEMKTVVYGQVTQMINLEKRRCGLKL